MKKIKIEKVYKDITAFLQEITEKVMDWLKEHKKLVLSGAVIYFLFAFLFDEDED